LDNPLPNAASPLATPSIGVCAFEAANSSRAEGLSPAFFLRFVSESKIREGTSESFSPRVLGGSNYNNIVRLKVGHPVYTQSDNSDRRKLYKGNAVKTTKKTEASPPTVHVNNFAALGRTFANSWD
jgi:hypothetical protein